MAKPAHLAIRLRPAGSRNRQLLQKKRAMLPSFFRFTAREQPMRLARSARRTGLPVAIQRAFASLSERGGPGLKPAAEFLIFP
jgi:hypothetical protein